MLAPQGSDVKLLTTSPSTASSSCTTALACSCNREKTLKGRFIAHKFSTGWAVWVVKSVEKEKSVADQFAVKYMPETYRWTKKLNKEDYGG